MHTGSSITLFGIPNCDQVKKARTWLAARAIPFVFHDFKKSGIAENDIQIWLKTLPWETLVNRKGTTWRALPPERKEQIIDASSAITLMLASSSVVKRPILCIRDASKNTHCYAGFSDTDYQAIFNL